ncbi:polysaccharide deacetylase family protein [Hymenobacter seoulensis]
MPVPAFLTPIAPVPAETRLAYVLRHFRLAYENVPAITIGYGPNELQIRITDGAGTFFNETAPYPQSPTMREWLGQKVPFFFDAEPEKSLLELLPEGRAIIQADIISAAFYLLSGWQEYYSEERDQHGRFPFAASVQHRYGFVTVPVVNYYFDVLKTAVEHVTGQRLLPRRWTNEATWAAFITHDIDNLYSAWKEPAKASLRRHDWLGFGRQLWRHLTTPDAWDNLADVQQIVASYGAKSTFFFLPEHRKAAKGTANADYHFHRISNSVNELMKVGAEIALHGSLGTSNQLDQLLDEAAHIRQLEQPSQGLRFHYLSWEPRATPALVDELFSAYDSTLGFAEHFGFRNSYCLPFHPFNFAAAEAYVFLEIPLNVMDATLHHPRYLQLQPEEILPALTPMLQEVERFGGVCTVLWHNENFDPANETTGPRQFAEIMEYLRSRAVAFVNGHDIVGMMDS